MSAREIREMALFHRLDDDPDLSWLSQTDEQMGEGFAEHGAARLASFGESWHMIGIRAEAEISVGGILQTITSGGLWGIESDSSAEYLRSVEDEELAQLREILLSLGFSAEEVAGPDAPSDRDEIDRFGRDCDGRRVA